MFMTRLPTTAPRCSPSPPQSHHPRGQPLLSGEYPWLLESSHSHSGRWVYLPHSCTLALHQFLASAWVRLVPRPASAVLGGLPLTTSDFRDFRGHGPRVVGLTMSLLRLSEDSSLVLLPSSLPLIAVSVKRPVRSPPTLSFLQLPSCPQGGSGMHYRCSRSRARHISAFSFAHERSASFRYRLDREPGRVRILAR